MSTYILSPKNKGMSNKEYIPLLSAYLLPPKKALCRFHSGRIRETSLAIIRHLSQTAHSVICIRRTAERSGVSQPHTPRGKVTGGPRAVQPEASYRTDLEDLSVRHRGETAFRAKEILPLAFLPRLQSAETLSQPGSESGPFRASSWPLRMGGLCKTSQDPKDNNPIQTDTGQVV